MEGETIVANYTCGFPDYVTEGKTYIVTKEDGHSFWITNDLGEECLPLLGSFSLSNPNKEDSQ